MKNFKDFSEEKIMDGKKINIDSILNKQINIISYRVSNSKFDNKKCLTIQFILNDERRVVFTGSNVLIDQMEKYKNEIPFNVEITKINKYYTLI